jgi:hypothetical protein
MRSQHNEHTHWFVEGTQESRSKLGTNTPAIQKECSVIPCLFVTQKFEVIIPVTDLIWTDFQDAVKLDSRTTLATPRRPIIATPRTWRLHYRLIQRIGRLTWHIPPKLHLGPDLLPRITTPTESVEGNREKCKPLDFVFRHSRYAGNGGHLMNLAGITGQRRVFPLRAHVAQKYNTQV